jgi:phospholipid/cholesterol/gamma-HCH transport system ATP-binding protein
MNRADDIIVVEDLELGYGENVVLEGVSFRVCAGEILTILGPSGCGKSTLLKALAGLLPSRRGRILVAGEEITSEYAAEALERARRRIGYLFQSGALLASFTVAENIAMPLAEFTDLPRELIDIMVQLKLDLVEMSHSGHLLPGELSGGMVKRAALARSLALDPAILFCDEPSAGLDPQSAREVDRLLLELNAFLGVTVVVVAHELGSIENLSSRCLMLHPDTKGIIASGSLPDLKSNPEARIQGFFQRHIERQQAEGPR